MSRKIVLILIFLLLCSSSIFLLARMVAADPSIYDDDFTILANGEINPSTAPVTTLDNMTYTLTRNCSLGRGIVVLRNNTILDGSGYTLDDDGSYAFGLKLDRVNNVTVRNINCRAAEGFYIIDASDCVLLDNNFTPQFVMGRGFYIENSTNLTLVQNTMRNTLFGKIYGDSISHYVHSIDTSNTVDGKPVYYLVNQRSLTVDPSGFPEIGYLALVNSSDITVHGLTLTNSTSTMLFAFSNNSRIVENTIGNSAYGTFVVSSSNNTISKNEWVDMVSPLTLDHSSCKNTISENRIETTAGSAIEIDDHSNGNTVSYNNISGEGGGITLSLFSSDNAVTENTISTSGMGVRLFQSQNNTFIKNSITNVSYVLDLEQACNNTFYQNNFEGSRQFYTYWIYGTNVWDNGLEGNYWSDYVGTDSNQDGIGDTPYVIDENNTDHYPLMGTFQSFNVSIAPQSSEEVDVISNFTISNLGLYEWLSTPNQYLQAGQPFLRLVPVQEQNMTAGFCRMTLPNNILNTSEYIVLINMTPINVNKLAMSNGTHTNLYFTFNSSALDGIIIVPEFPSFLVIPLFMVAMLLPIAIYERRHRTRAV